MALKLSTGFRNFKSGEGTLRKAFEDSILNIYSGTPPADADAAPTGVLLLKVTKASGAVAFGDRSTPQIGLILVGSHGSGETFAIDVTVDGVGPTTYTYTNTPDLDLAPLAVKIAQMLNDIPQLMAIASGSDGNIFVASRIAGLTFTIAEGTDTGTLTTVTSEVLAATVVNTLKLGAPVAGVISKTTDVWSGMGLAVGTCAYYRHVTSLDTGAPSTTEVRIQGTVSTSGADLDMSNINITVGPTYTVDKFEYTEPATRT